LRRLAGAKRVKKEVWAKKSIDGNVPPERVINASKTFPALDDWPRNTMQAKMLVNISPTHGTPALFARPINLGALPLRDMKSSVREAT